MPATVAELRVAHDAAVWAVNRELRYLWDPLSGNEKR
jgi:hypothetical protein